MVVTEDWGNSVLRSPTPGKGRPHAKHLAEQVVRFITSLGLSTVIIKADREPSTRRQRLGFRTVLEMSGPDPDGARSGKNPDLAPEAWCKDRDQHLRSHLPVGNETCGVAADTLPKESSQPYRIPDDSRSKVCGKAGSLWRARFGKAANSEWRGQVQGGGMDWQDQQRRLPYGRYF